MATPLLFSGLIKKSLLALIFRNHTKSVLPYNVNKLIQTLSVIIFPVIFFSHSVHSQGVLAALDQEKVYDSFEEAFKTPEKVVVLDVSKQKLTKLPDNIDQLTNLKKLVLSENKLKELPANIVKLQNLQHLEIAKNKLKRLPTGFEQLQSLRYLDLAKNKFRHIPEAVFQLKQLETFYFFGNKERKVAPAIAQMQQLKVLRLGDNRIRQLPDNFGQMPRLKELFLPDNRLRALPSSFNQLDSLEWLELNHNRFRSLPQELKGLKNLHITYFWDRGFPQKNKEDVEKALPKTQFNYDDKYAGKYWGIYAGFQQGNQSVVELGWVKGFKKDFLTYHYGLGGEYYLNGNTLGIKAGGWVNALIAVGLQAGFYLEDDKKAGTIRPEIGLGLNLFSLMYGYNFVIGDKLNNLNRHMVSLRVTLPIAPFFFP
ncbi:hypothetical protein BKI52_41760 [marine bacterium AO1-C]|nr:hypothetical protein BKI52_41760 [marine bacterium AO1-C]